MTYTYKREGIRMLLKNKVVIITGASVYLTARREENLREVACEIHRYGGKIIYHTGNNDLTEKFGSIAHLVANLQYLKGHR